jgi:hypothetical protein
MNIKKSLKRLWMIVSVLWIVWVYYYLMSSIDTRSQTDFLSEFGLVAFLTTSYMVQVSGLIVWWGLFYIGFWISSFFGGDKINKSESDEQINSKTTKLIIRTLLLTYLFLLWRERLILIPVINSYLQ